MSVTYLTSQIDDLKNIQASAVNIFGWASSGDGGQGIFLWNAGKDKQLHDGGSIIDPSHSADVGTIAWYNPENTGNGCWVRQGEYDCRAFGLFPGIVERDVVQHFIKVQSAKRLVASFIPGKYIGDTNKTFGERVIDLPNDTWVSAYKAEFEDLFWQATEVDGCFFEGGRYYNKAANTSWLFDINVKNAHLIDCLFDQEEPATSKSPWMYIRENSNMQPENIWLTRCIFKKRTNVQLWNVRNCYITDCDLLNDSYEDGFVLKTRKGFGVCENVTITGGTQEKTTGAIDIGTQVGEDIRNITATNVSLSDCSRALFVQAIDDVNASESLNGGHISNLTCSNLTIENIGRLSNICLIQCNSGSHIERIVMNNIVVKGRSKDSFESSLFHITANEGSLVHDVPSYVRDVRAHNIVLEDAHPGAEGPDETDLNGETSVGYDIDYVAKTIVGANNTIEDVYLSNITTRGIFETSPPRAQTGVTYNNIVMKDK